MCTLVGIGLYLNVHLLLPTRMREVCARLWVLIYMWVCVVTAAHSHIIFGVQMLTSWEKRELRNRKYILLAGQIVAPCRAICACLYAGVYSCCVKVHILPPRVWLYLRSTVMEEKSEL